MHELICRADDRAAWLAARATGVTATDIAVILGLSSHASPYSLYWQKMGQVPETPDNDRLRLGRVLEPEVISRWQEANPDADQRGPNGNLFRSTARPWQMATLDALVYVAGSESVSAVLEVKTWADADKPSWGHTGPYSGPPAIRAQVLWQMDVMEAPVGHVGVLFLPSGEFRHYTIEHEELGHADIPATKGFACGVCDDLKMMRAAGEEFYRRLRMELPPPDPDNSAATLAAAKARFTKAKGKRAQVDGHLWDLWLDSKAVQDLAAARIREYESQIREQLGEADEIEVDGHLAGRRVIAEQNVKAHTRHMDYIKRTKAGNDE